MSTSYATTPEDHAATRERVFTNLEEDLRQATSPDLRKAALQRAVDTLVSMEPPRRPVRACGLCGKPPTGLAQIGMTRYCHDGADSCYETAQHRLSKGGRS